MKTIIDQILDLYQEKAHYDFTQTPEYKELGIQLEELRKQLVALVPHEAMSTAQELIGGLHDIATTPIFFAELHGYREGFKAALNLLKELERLA